MHNSQIWYMCYKSALHSQQGGNVPQLRFPEIDEIANWNIEGWPVQQHPSNTLNTSDEQLTLDSKQSSR